MVSLVTKNDYGKDIVGHTSTTGQVFLIGSRAMTLCSKWQPTVAISKTEAEYMVLSAGG